MNNRILALQDRVRDLTINNKEEYTLIWVDMFDESNGVFCRSPNLSELQKQADLLATEAIQDNDPNDETEMTTRYYIYDSKGEFVGKGNHKNINYD